MPGRGIQLARKKQILILEIALRYLIGDGDLDFEVVHWATPPSVVVNIMEGCSPFFNDMAMTSLRKRQLEICLYFLKCAGILCAKSCKGGGAIV